MMPDDVERGVTRIWAEVLGLQEVRSDDTFLSLGGDSVTGMRLVMQLGEELHVEVPLSMMLENPTLRTLVQHAVQLCEQKSRPMDAAAQAPPAREEGFL